MSSLSNPPVRKRYVTRACDACRRRKSKCNGAEPCSRCVSSDIACSYKLPYTRGQAKRQFHDSTRSQAYTDNALTTPLNTVNSSPGSNLLLSPATSGQADLQSNEDDASIDTFLRRVSAHLAQVGRGLPRSLFGRDQEVHIGKNQGHTCILPSKSAAQSYLDCYFEHASTTYRYIPRDDVFEHFEQVFAEQESALQEDTKMAKLLFVMGIGCIWSASWRKEPLHPWKQRSLRLLRAAQARLEMVPESFSPSIELLQAHVLKCQLELYSGRFNSAWMTLGWAIRLGQMINIQKQPLSCNTVDSHFRVALFCAMFMMDRYLAVSLGRPFAIQDSDTTVLLTTEVESAVGSGIGDHETKLWVGVISHVRLTKIIGHIMTLIYPGARPESPPSEGDIDKLENELQAWLDQTPAFFHPKPRNQAGPDSLFYDVPWIFQRQQRTIQGAFFFANMLLYRGYLLREFLQQEPNTPRSGFCSERVKKCADNAMAMVALAAEFGAEEYKLSTHFIYCSISILIVYLTLYQESAETNSIKSAVENAIEVHLNFNRDNNSEVQDNLETTLSRSLQLQHVTEPLDSTSGQQQAQTDRLHGGGIAALELENPAAQHEGAGMDSVLSDDGSTIYTSLGSQQTLSDFGLFDQGNDLDLIMAIGFDSHPIPDSYGTGDVFGFQ